MTTKKVMRAIAAVAQDASVVITLSGKERDAILAGLRLLQERLHWKGRDPDLVDEIYLNGRTVGLPSNSIDRLCERINK